MSNIDFGLQADVFEYCEKRFEYLKIKDNGYHPRTYDKVVFEDAAKHFNISVEEVEKIFEQATKKIAQIYLKQKGKMTKDQNYTKFDSSIRLKGATSCRTLASEGLIHPITKLEIYDVHRQRKSQR